MDERANHSKRWRALVIAALSLCALVLVNTIIIFREGWILPGFPHTYIYTALQKYHNSIVGGLESGGYNTVWDLHFNDNLSSPLYQLSALFGHIGEPTPQWFRLTGVVLLVLIFFVSYFLLPALSSSTDRLVVAMTVATTPVVFFVTRYLEDFGIHILVLLAGVALLMHSRMGRATRRVLVFYFLPALDLLLTHMITNFFITMMSLVGIYLYSLFVRIREAGLVSVIKSEIPRLILAVAAFAIIDKIRTPRGVMFFLRYYRGETAGFEAFPISWLSHLLAYPGVLFFSSAGIVLCLVALLNFRWKSRGQHVWMYLLWFLIPLLFLTLISKKNTYYVWTLSPAISLLAASAILKLSLKWKRLWIIACFAFAALHVTDFAAPLEGVLPSYLFQVRCMIDKPCQLPTNYKRDMEISHEVLKLATMCGPLEKRPLVVVQPPYMVPLGLYFAMLYLDRQPVYWPLISHAVDLSSVVAVEVNSFDIGFKLESDSAVFWFLKLVDKYRELILTHELVYESSDYKVYCP